MVHTPDRYAVHERSSKRQVSSFLLLADFLFCGVLPVVCVSDTDEMIDKITAITVNYNTPDLLDEMIWSFRQFYDTPIIVVDGSESKHRSRVLRVVGAYKNIMPHIMGYNIHHGGGLTYALNLVKTERVLFIDSDVIFHKGGFLDDLNDKLKDTSYGIGDVQIVDEKGFNKPTGIKYLHPAFCLLNMDMVKQFPMPIVHGAPMIETMKAIHRSGLNILQHEKWVTNDFRNKEKKYLTHDWQGTVSKYGYNL